MKKILFLPLLFFFALSCNKHNGNQEILSEPVRGISLPDGKKLVTLDDETVSDPEQLKNNGKFVIICQNVSCREMSL